jgi:hypothetical protein
MAFFKATCVLRRLPADIARPPRGLTGHPPASAAMRRAGAGARLRWVVRDEAPQSHRPCVSGFARQPERGPVSAPNCSRLLPRSRLTCHNPTLGRNFQQAHTAGAVWAPGNKAWSLLLQGTCEYRRRDALLKAVHDGRSPRQSPWRGPAFRPPLRRCPSRVAGRSTLGMNASLVHRMSVSWRKSCEVLRSAQSCGHCAHVLRCR